MSETSRASAAAHLGYALRALDEEQLEIVADGRRQIEYARRLTRERLALHAVRRRALLGVFAAATAAAQEARGA